MRSCFLLLAIALVVAASTLVAQADTYEFIVSNFDGYGSSATFLLPSSTSGIYQVHGNVFVESSQVNFTFGAGVPIPSYLAYLNGLTNDTTTSETYFSDELNIGFSDRSYDPSFVLGVVSVSPPDYQLYHPATVALMSFNSPLFTVNDDVATFKLGTFTTDPVDGDAEGITVVNATPEPSTLVLLGTGVLGLAGIARRRLLTRS